MNWVRSKRWAFYTVTVRVQFFLLNIHLSHSKSKHIQMRYFFIRYLIEDKLLILEKIYGSKNPTDMLTEGVTIEKLKLCTTLVDLLAKG